MALPPRGPTRLQPTDRSSSVAGPDSIVDMHALARAAATGDRTAFSALMRILEKPVHQIARRWTGAAGEADDVAQGVFVSLWQMLQAGRVPDNPGAFLRRATLNACRDWSRRRAVRAFFFTAVPLDDQDRSSELLEDTRGEDIRLADLDAAIAALPDGLKAPLILCALDGVSQKEAAQLLGVTTKAVETRIARAKSRLRDALKG